jgi:hypothetical protein
MPCLVGDLTSFGALVGTGRLAETIAHLVPEVKGYEEWSGIPFSDRVADKRAEAGRHDKL